MRVNLYDPPKLCALREQLGLTQEEMAELLGVVAWERVRERAAPNGNMVSKWECGQKKPGTLYRRCYRVLLAATPEEMAAFMAQLGCGIVEDMKRRQALGLAVALSAAAVLEDGLVRHSTRVPDLTDVVLDGFRAQTEGLRWLDRRDGARKHLAATASYSSDLANLWRLEDANHSLRSALAEVAADASHLVAYQAFDQGQHTQAIEWYRCSADLARRSGNQDLYVFALCGVAYMRAQNGEAVRALSGLRQLELLPLSPTAQCYVAVYEAHAHASAKRLDLALQALDSAAAWSDETKNEAPASWLGIPDTSFVERQRGMILAQFGTTQALPLLHRLEQNASAVFRRYRVTLATDLALTYAYGKEVEQSAEQLTSALQLNQQTHSVDRTQRILKIRAMLDPYRNSRAVRSLDEVLRTTVKTDRAVGAAVTVPAAPRLA